MLLEALTTGLLASGMSAVAKGGLVVGAKVVTAVPAAVGGVIIQSKINEKENQKLMDRKAAGEMISDTEIKKVRAKAAVKGGLASATLMGVSCIGFNIANQKIWYSDLSTASIGSQIGSNSLV